MGLHFLFIERGDLLLFASKFTEVKRIDCFCVCSISYYLDMKFVGVFRVTCE